MNKKWCLVVARFLIFPYILSETLTLPYKEILPSKVIVTGAAGRTGKLVFQSLHHTPRVEAVGLVRSERSAKKLRKSSHCGLEELVVCDVAAMKNMASSSEEEEIIPRLRGAEAMVICTSAIPRVSKLSILKAFLIAPWNVVSGKKPFNFRTPHFKYKNGQYPEIVDYEGQKYQIDLAKKIGISHVVLVSSMGGTDPNHFLNTIGKNKYGSGHGDILIWKRKSEEYLMRSGLCYTIIHPGELLEPSSKNGAEKVILDVDDKLLSHRKASISRTSVASLCIAALSVCKRKRLSFDCVADVGQDDGSVNPPDQVLNDFLITGKTTSYANLV